MAGTAWAATLKAEELVPGSKEKLLLAWNGACELAAKARALLAHYAAVGAALLLEALQASWAALQDAYHRIEQ